LPWTERPQEIVERTQATAQDLEIVEEVTGWVMAVDPY
jgi:hypothetical protein